MRERTGWVIFVSSVTFIVGGITYAIEAQEPPVDKTTGQVYKMAYVQDRIDKLEQLVEDLIEQTRAG